MKPIPAIVVLLAALASVSAQTTRSLTSPPMADTGVISGTVMSMDTPPVPVRLARVTLNAVERGGPAATTTTDADGRFAFDGLPAGRYQLQASRRAWLDANYGATRIGRPGTPVALTAGQHVANLTIAMARGAVITGTVRDDRGEPQPAITVAVRQFVTVNGARTLVRPANVFDPVTDADGVYRAWGLPPGDYIVMAAISPGGTSGLTSEVEIRPMQPREGSRTVGNAPVFYPGTTDLAAATTIAVAPGEERTGIDVPFRLYPTARVYGTVAGFISDSANGRNALRLTPAGADQITNTVLAASVAGVDSAGRYAFDAVPPGRYSLLATAMEAPRGGNGATIRGWTRADVSVNGQDVEMNLTLDPASTLSGRFVFEGGTPASLPVPGLDVNVRAFGDARLLGPQRPLRPGPDATFALPSLIGGLYMIAASAPRDSPWVLKSAMVRGIDAADQPFEVQSGENVSDVVVTFTNHPSEVKGTLQDAAGRPASEYFVIVFPADRAAWLPTSRRIQSARPGNDGRFSLKGLPAGDYLLGALTDVEPGEWFEAPFLERIAAGAVNVHVTDGAVTDVPALKVGGGH